jgi:branched-chain amino acid transport system substrate-binding protein
MTHNKTLPGAGRTAMVAALVAGGLVAGSAAQAEVRIGAVLPLTGPLATYGEAASNGVTLAEDEINAAGGVLGEPFRVITADTATAPAVGVDAAQRLVSVEGVAGLVGAFSSGVTIPIATSVSAVEGVPQISPASTSPVITTLADNGFLFRTTPHDALQGAVLADLVEERGVGRVAVIYVNNDYGRGLAEAFEASFGGSVTASVAYEERQASYRGELAGAHTGDPEALVLISYPGDGIPMMRQSVEEGFFDHFIFTDGMKATEVAEALGDLLDGSFGTAPGADPDREASQRFRQMYEAAFGELPPQPFIDGTYDAVMLLALAIEHAGSTDGEAIRDALHVVANPPGEPILPGDFAKAKELIAAGQDINYDGAAGPQDFDEVGDVPGTYSLWEVQGGAIVDIDLVTP